MPHYNTILDIINNTLDNKDISSSEIAKHMNVPRQKIVDFRNEDIKDKSLLFELFDYLCPDKAQQDFVFLQEMMESAPLIQLKNLYSNNQFMKEELQYIKSYQYDELMNDVLRKIVIKTSRNKLREIKHEDNLVGEGLGRAGAEGFIGGAAMVAGSILAKKVTDKIAGKNKRKQIEELEDEKRELRKQMRQKDEDPEGREALRKRISSIDSIIDQVRGLMG